MPNKDWNEELLLNMARKYVADAEKDAAENPTSEEILIVVVEPNKKPYKMMMINDLDEMKKLVDGYIEILNIGRTEKGAAVAITLNEEGKLKGLPVNRFIVGFDIIVGRFFITAYNMQGDNISLTDKEADYYIKRFSKLEVYL
jgi:hypothetical protein